MPTTQSSLSTMHRARTCARRSWASHFGAPRGRTSTCRSCRDRCRSSPMSRSSTTTKTPGSRSASKPRKRSRTSFGVRADIRLVLATSGVGVTAITIEGVGRSFSAVRAVDAVSIPVRDGEFFTLLGPSGYGKTTLLRMVAGFCELDSGRILFGEQRIDTLPPHKRNTGMVFQNYAVFPNLTVGGNVAYGLRARSVPSQETRERVTHALKLVQLEGFAERWPHQLSGGQLQRVAIARQIVTEPHVLPLDEPLSNLDAKLRVEMRGEIRRLQKLLGITVLYVTHDQEEALAVSDRVAVMRAGRVEQVADPRAIYERPETPFVAGFVGTTNLLDGVIRARDGAVTEVAVAGTTLRLDGVQGSVGERVVLSVR